MGDRTQVNQFDIVGRVIFVGMPIYISAKMSKRILVMEIYVENRWAKEVPFEFINDHMDKLNNVRINDWVEVVFYLSSNHKVQGDGKKHWWPSNAGIACTVIQKRS